MTETASSGVKELLESTCDLERVAVVFNPVSGVEDLATRRSELEKLVRSAGLQCELTETDKDTGAAPLARKAVEDRMERVLVSGGDGSVTEAADILAGTDVTLGVLPGGTGNLLALNLGIPADCERALELALKGQPRLFDVGRANGKVFLILAGMGADGRMIRDADRETKQRLGVMAYFLAALRQMRRQRVRYTIQIDGRTLVRRAMTVMVANLGRITGGVELVPGCDPYDGLLEVAILRARGPIDIAALALSVLFGARRRDLLEVRRGRHIVVESRRPQPVEIDGNEAGIAARLEVDVQPGALRLVAPAAGAEVSPARVLLETTARKVHVGPVLGGAAVAFLIYRRGRNARRGHQPGSAAVAAAASLFLGAVAAAGLSAAPRAFRRMQASRGRSETPVGTDSPAPSPEAPQGTSQEAAAA